MTIELQPIFNLAISGLIGVALYFFKMSQNHEKRIQKIEDISSMKFEHLIEEIQDLKKQIEHVTLMVEKTIDTENNMSMAVDLLVSHLKKSNEKN